MPGAKSLDEDELHESSEIPRRIEPSIYNQTIRPPKTNPRKFTDITA